MEKVYIVVSNFVNEKVDVRETRIERICKSKETAEKHLAKLAEKAKSYALENFVCDDLEIDSSSNSFSVYKNYEYDTYHENIYRPYYPSPEIPRHIEEYAHERYG